MNYLDFVKKYAALPALFISGLLEASSIGLIGGGNGSSAYAALVSSSEAVTSLPIPGISSSGFIDDVAMNHSGQGIIGGQDSSASPRAYAALMSPTGVLTKLTLPGIPSSLLPITTVAINDSGYGIIGGGGAIVNASYAALVSPAGVVTSLNPNALNVFAVAINNSRWGLIGGRNPAPFNMEAPYAAFVSPSGSLTQLTISTHRGWILAGAINSSAKGLIGGRFFPPILRAYAAFVLPSGSVMPLTLPGLTSVDGAIFSCAINDASYGIVGGQDYSIVDDPGFIGRAYAALVSPDGSVKQLALPGLSATQNSYIASVALNSSNLGLIGGQNVNVAYAAFVSSTGVVTPLNLGIPSGVISSVAINDFGQGFIGGQKGTAAYAALVLPSGTIIPLNLGLSNGAINSVALLSFSLTSALPTLSGNNSAFAKYINKYAPDRAFYFIPSFLDGTLNQALASAAPTRNAFSIFTAGNNVFYLDTLLSNHSRGARNIRRQAMKPAPSQTSRKNLQFASTFDIPTTELLAWSSTSERTAPPPPPKEHPYELWGTMLGALAYQKKQHQTPAFNPTTGGMILGFDGKTSRNNRLGTGAAYTYTYIHEKQDAGRIRINQEYLFLYNMWDNTRWYVDTAIMTGFFQINNLRKISMTGFEFESKSRVNGWQLAPHFETGYDYNFYDRKFTAEPFVMLDWVSNWQGSYKEHGDGPFNAGQKSHFSSFLRSETGLRFYETIRYDSWNFTVEEKISYVNKKPFKVGRVNAFLVGAPGSFTVETLTTTQNLGVAELEFVFQPHKHRYPCTTLAYQGEFGSMYQSHIVSLELNWSF